MRSKFAGLTAALLICAWSSPACVQDNSSSEATAPSQKPLNEPLYEKFTAEAWAAFHAGRYEAAITNADLCIARFGEAAQRIQTILEAEKTTLPTGTVSEADKKRIAKYQILHDVATCLLLKGWAEEKLGHKQEARHAHTEAAKYTYARSSLPTGESFWSPAEAASKYLAKP